MVTQKRVVDIWTLIAIGVVVYIIANVLHEGVGHGGACLLVGGSPKSLSTAYFECDCPDESIFCEKTEAAAGTIANLIAALIGWVVFRMNLTGGSRSRYFWWLFMSVNLFVATGYLLFSGVSKVGDWMVVISGYEPAWLWRLILVFVGAILYLLSVWVSLRELSRLIGKEESFRIQVASRLSVVPYLAGSTLTTIGAAFNPITPLLILTSAAAHFGGTSALAWMTQLLRNPKSLRLPVFENGSIEIQRSIVWITVAAVLLALHIAVLGPAISFE